MPTNPGKSNLLAFYEFEETAGNDAICSNGTGPAIADQNTVARVTGKVNNAAHVSVTAGVNNKHFANASVASILQIGSGDYSIAVWVNCQTTPAAGDSLTICSISKSGSGGGGVVMRISPTQLENFAYNSSGTTQSNALYIGASWPATWKFFILVHEAATDSFDIYYDNGASLGVQEWTWSSFTPADVPADGTVTIGKEAGTATAAAYIDQLIIFDKALSSDERDFVYNSGAGIEYFDLKEPTGNLTTFGIADQAEVIDQNKNFLIGTTQLITGTFNEEIQQDELGLGMVKIRFNTITTGDTPQADLAQLDADLKAIDYFRDDPSESDSHWLHIKHTDYTARKALIYSISRRELNTNVTDPLGDASKHIVSEWTIIRYPNYEALTAAQITLQPINFSNGNIAIDSSGREDQTLSSSTYQKGTRPGRISTMKLKTPASGNNPNRGWIGFKRRAVTFQSYWDAAAGSPENLLSTSNVADANAFGASGNAREVQYSTYTDWRDRVQWKLTTELSGVAKADLVGQYLILARMMTTDGAEHRVTMYETNGFFTSSPKTYHGDIYVANSVYHFYEMGIVTVPSYGARYTIRQMTNWLDGYRIGLASGRMAGTGKLRVDYFVLIPYDHMMYWRYPIDTASFAWSDSWAAHMEDEQLVAIAERLQTGALYEHALGEIAVNNWGFPFDPTEGCTLIAAADYDIGSSNAITSSLEGNTMTNLTVVPRYDSYNKD